MLFYFPQIATSEYLPFLRAAVADVIPPFDINGEEGHNRKKIERYTLRLNNYLIYFQLVRNFKTDGIDETVIDSHALQIALTKQHENNRDGTGVRKQGYEI